MVDSMLSTFTGHTVLSGKSLFRGIKRFLGTEVGNTEHETHKPSWEQTHDQAVANADRACSELEKVEERLKELAGTGMLSHIPSI